MTFDYFKVETAMDSVDIEDIGNVCLRCSNDDALEWYLKIKTELGWCYVTHYGPLRIDSNHLDTAFYFSFQPFEYSEKKLYKIINDFLNNPKRTITVVEIIDVEIFIDRLEGIENVW